MADDLLLSTLGQLAQDQQRREQQQLDTDWDALSADTLDADAHARLRRRAQRDPLARDAYDAFRPLGKAFESRMADTIRRDLTQSDPSTSAWSGSGVRRALAYAAVLLTTVGLVYLLGRGATSTALPAYALEVEGDVQTVRSAASDAAPASARVHRLIPGSRLRLVLRPSTAVDGAVATRLYLRSKDGSVRTWPFESTVEVDPRGAVLIESTITADPLARLADGQAEWQLLALIGHIGRLPLAVDLDRGRGDGWQVLETPVSFAAAP